jgi:hypothetical protein
MNPGWLAADQPAMNLEAPIMTRSILRWALNQMTKTMPGGMLAPALFEVFDWLEDTWGPVDETLLHHAYTEWRAMNKHLGPRPGRS